MRSNAFVPLFAPFQYHRALIFRLAFVFHLFIVLHCYLFLMVTYHRNHINDPDDIIVKGYHEYLFEFEATNNHIRGIGRTSEKKSFAYVQIQWHRFRNFERSAERISSIEATKKKTTTATHFIIKIIYMGNVSEFMNCSGSLFL